MEAQEITLHIAMNLSRLCRWAMSGNRERIDQFIKDTDMYVKLLDEAPKKQDFLDTYALFKKKYNHLKSNIQLNDEWAEDVMTWGNILTHRAKLA